MPDRTDEPTSAQIQRISLAAAVTTDESYMAKMANWDPATTTDRAFRIVVLENSNAVLDPIRVRRRDRIAVRDEAVAVACEAYTVGRYLLGTQDAHPQYSTTENDADKNALALNNRVKAYDWGCPEFRGTSVAAR